MFLLHPHRGEGVHKKGKGNMRKFMMVLPCLLLVHGVAAANEISSRNDRQDETNKVLTAAFESARAVERPSMLSAPAGTELQYAAKKRSKTAAAPARSEAPPAQGEGKSSKSHESGDRFYMTQNGKQMTADDFDAWMKKNGYRVVGGTPATSKKVAELKKEK